jgi:hypothetical protein
VLAVINPLFVYVIVAIVFTGWAIPVDPRLNPVCAPVCAPHALSGHSWQLRHFRNIAGKPCIDGKTRVVAGFARCRSCAG